MASDNPLTPQPLEIQIGGRAFRLSYPMHAVILYQRETARIERSRPKADDPDPRCICGARRSLHIGLTLIRLGENQELLCPRFRAEDPLLGDSLFLFEAWTKIDLNIDPERWLACLWCGLHERREGKWRAQITLDELSELIGVCPDTRRISDAMFDALAAWMPKAEKVPNVAASGEPTPAASDANLPTSKNSSPGLVTATDSAATNS